MPLNKETKPNQINIKDWYVFKPNNLNQSF